MRFSLAPIGRKQCFDLFVLTAGRNACRTKLENRTEMFRRPVLCLQSNGATSGTSSPYTYNQQSDASTAYTPKTQFQSNYYGGP